MKVNAVFPLRIDSVLLVMTNRYIERSRLCPTEENSTEYAACVDLDLLSEFSCLLLGTQV